jgi:photosystem II stability/assembly factor-like uncharacterized protein
VAAIEAVAVDQTNPDLFDRDSKRIYAHKASSWWRSDDGGRSWSKGEAPSAGLMSMLRGKVSDPQFQSLVQDPADSKILYAGSWSNRDPGTAVFKTTDGGKEWKPAGTGITSQRVTLLRSAAPGKLFAVGGEEGIFRTGTFYGVFRSTDGGTTWTAFTNGLVHTDVRALSIAGGSPARLYAGTAGGSVYSTELP